MNDSEHFQGSSDSQVDDAAMMKEIRTMILATVGGLAGSLAIGLAVNVIKGLLTSNYERKGLEGDQEAKVLETETEAVNDEASAKDNSASASKNGFSGTDGEVNAQKTDAVASENDTVAADISAGALKNQKNALKTETNALHVV